MKWRGSIPAGISSLPPSILRLPVCKLLVVPSPCFSTFDLLLLFPSFFSEAATSVSHKNWRFAQSSDMLVSLIVWSIFVPVHGRCRNGTAFYTRWAFLLIKTEKLTFDDDFSPWEKSWVCNDPSQPVWWQNDDARVQGLGSLLCDSRTLIDCPLWVWTLPPLPRYAEKASWGFEDPYPHWASIMKPLLIVLSYPFWNSLSLHCNLRSKLFGVVEACDKHMPLKVRMPST